MLNGGREAAFNSAQYRLLHPTIAIGEDKVNQMSVTQPVTSLASLFGLDGKNMRGSVADGAAAKDLRKGLANRVAPLAALSQEQRRRITRAKLEKLAAALDEVRPAWLHDYAAEAATQLPTSEKRMRAFMLHMLFKDETQTVAALAALTEQMQMLPAAKRPNAISAILDNLGRIAELRTSRSSDELEAALMALMQTAKVPATPLAFARAALPLLHVMAVLFPGAGYPAAVDDGDAVSRLLPLFDPPYRAFLLRKNWGAFAGEISAALWDQLWRRGRGAAKAPAPGQGALHQHLIKEANWAEADAAIGRALQDIGILTRSFDKLEAVADGDAAVRAKAAKGASNLILQWVRQAARYRDIEIQCEAGQRAEFDPVFHDSDEAMPGEPVRIVKPPIVRSGGTRQVVLLRGDVEPE